VVAAGGLRVAKHGNRSVSSRSGSADLVEALGVPFASTPAEVGAALERDGFAFLFAPAFHRAAAGVAAARRALGIPTVFNLLGPLVNPARPTHQLTGTGGSSAAQRMAQALARLDLRRAYVVRGADGWDEATPVGPFELHEVVPGRVRSRRVDPAEYGLARCSAGDLAGGDAAENAALLRAVLAGEADLDRSRRLGALRDAIVLNAALVLQLTGRESAPRAAAQLAARTIESGRARSYLARLAAGRGAVSREVRP